MMSLASLFYEAFEEEMTHAYPLCVWSIFGLKCPSLSQAMCKTLG